MKQTSFLADEQARARESWEMLIAAARFRCDSQAMISQAPIAADQTVQSFDRSRPWCKAVNMSRGRGRVATLWKLLCLAVAAGGELELRPLGPVRSAYAGFSLAISNGREASSSSLAQAQAMRRGLGHGIQSCMQHGVILASMCVRWRGPGPFFLGRANNVPRRLADHCRSRLHPCPQPTRPPPSPARTPRLATRRPERSDSLVLRLLHLDHPNGSRRSRSGPSVAFMIASVASLWRPRLQQPCGPAHTRGSQRIRSRLSSPLPGLFMSHRILSPLLLPPTRGHNDQPALLLPKSQPSLQAIRL